VSGPELKRVNGEDGWPVMRGERRVRFACGVIAGTFAGCQLAPRLGAAGAGTVLLVAGISLAFGISAAVLGDRFWRGLRWW